MNFQRQKSIKNQYLAPSESKSYQINSTKSCSSRSFQQQNTKGTIPIPPKKFQLRFYLIFSEEIIHSIFKNFCTASPNSHGTKPMQPSLSRAFQRHRESWNQAHAPLLVKSFPKTPRTQSEASSFGGSHNYKTKQTTFLPS